MKLSLEKSIINKIIRHSKLLVIWSILTVYLMSTFNSVIHWIALVIYLLVVILSLVDVHSILTNLTLVLGSALIIYINYISWGLGQTFYVNSGLTILGIWVARYLSARCIKGKHALKAALQEDHQRMDQYMVYDPESGLMRQRFAEKALSTAMARSQRLNLPLSLMMIETPQHNDFPNAEKYSTHKLFGELFLKNLREDVDIPFINEKYGVILPEMDLKMTQITAQEMAEDIARILDVDITIGIASMTEELTTADALMTAAKSALETGLEIGQPVATHQVLAPQPNQDPNLQDIIESVQDQELKQYLQNPSLIEDEWIVWLNGIEDIATIQWIKERFQSSPSIQFLTAWDQFVVVKMVTGNKDTALFATAFPDWEIQDIDIEKRFVLLSPVDQKNSPHENN